MRVGDKKTFPVMIDENHVQTFAAFSKDYNPIHVDLGVAEKSEFQGRIAHGAILLAHASKMLGMDLPGPGCVILRQDVQFPKALRYPEEVSFEGELVLFNEERGDGKVVIHAKSRQGLHLVAHAFFLLHGQKSIEKKSEEAGLKIAARKPKNTGKKCLLITGGTGGVGTPIVQSLAEEYECVVLTRKHLASETIRYCCVDVEDPDQLEGFLLENDPIDYFGIVHMSSPKPVERRLIGSIQELKQQFYHSVDLPVRLAQWADQPGTGVCRMILMGSTAGSKKLERSMPVYSLAKTVVDPLGRSLAMDLARRGIRVNTVAPGFIASGINAGIPERQQTHLAGMSPTGRLTRPDDVAAVIRFLLSPDADQINGMLLTVDGGVV